MIKRITQIFALCLFSLSAFGSLVTFEIDMNCYPGDLSAGVTMGSDWNGPWCAECIFLDDTDGDGIYTTTIDVPDGFHEFKFTIGNWADQESLIVGEPCTMTTGAFTNRTIMVSPGINVYTAAWNSCAADCASVNQPGDVTFCVCAAGAPAGTVYLNGTFNEWNGSDIPMENISDDLWCVTMPNLPAGPQQFKFTVDGWNFQEEFTAGDGCTFTNEGFTNRIIQVNGGEALPVYDWNSCNETTNGACLLALPMELTAFDVTKEGTSAQIEWSTASDDTGNTFVVEYSRDAINFEEIGTVYGTSARGENNYSFKHYLLANGENYYRLKNIDAEDNIQYSNLRSLDIVATTKMSINPTVSNADINIQLDDSQIEAIFYIYNILGEKVFEYNIIDTNFSVNISDFPIGQYIGVVQNGNEVVSQKFIKTY